MVVAASRIDARKVPTNGRISRSASAVPTRAVKHAEKHARLFQRGYTGTVPGALRGRAYRSPHVGRHPTRACATVLDESRLPALPSVARLVRRPSRARKRPRPLREISARLTRHVAGLKRKRVFASRFSGARPGIPQRGWISDGWHASRWRSEARPTPTHMSAVPAWQRLAL